MSALINKHAFGIHITDVAVKAAELEPIGNSFNLIAYGSRNLPAGAVVDGAIDDPKKTAEEIIKLIQSPIFGSFKTSFVIVSLPESRVFLKAIKVPKFAGKKIKEALAWEAKSLLPIPPEQGYHQAQILEEKEKEIIALIAATERRLVDDYLKTLQIAELVPLAFDLECYAAARTLKETELANRVVLLLHIGTKVTTFTVLRNGQVWFSRAINTGITAAAGYGKEVVDRNSLQQAVRHIAAGIKSTVRFYHGQIDKKEHQVEIVTLTGGLSTIPNIVGQIQQAVTDLPVAVVEPRLKITNQQLAKYRGLPLFTSVGLALRGAHPARWAEDLNFLPERVITDFKTQEIRAKVGHLLAILAALSLSVVIVLSFFLGKVYLSYRNIQHSTQNAKREVEKHPAREFFSWTDEANKQLVFLQDLEKKRLPFHAFLQRIVTAVPKGIVFDSLNYTKENNMFAINGIADSRIHLLAFANKLQNDPLIDNVVVPLSSLNEGSGGVFTLTFSIKLEEADK